MKVVLTYLLCLAGLVVSIAAFAQAVGKEKYASLKPRLLHALRMSSQRAQTLCMQMPHSFLEAVNGAIVAGARAYTQDPAALAAVTRPAFDAVCPKIKAHWQPIAKLAKTGGGLALGGIVLAMLIECPMLVQGGIALVALALAGLTLLHDLDVTRSLMRARAEVLPEVDRMFVEGRYVYASAG